MRTGVFRHDRLASDYSTEFSPRFGGTLPSRRKAGSLPELLAGRSTSTTRSQPTKAVSLLARPGPVRNRGLRGNAPGLRAGRAGRPEELCQGELFVAQPALRGGAAQWQQYQFKHCSDGALSFQAVNGPGAGPRSDDERPSVADSDGANTRQGAGSTEFVLDADWRKPFIAAPWRPLQRSQSDARQGHDSSVAAFLETSASSSCAPPPASEGQSGGALAASSSGSGEDRLYPFTLSYAPVPAAPGEADATAPPRRTMVLATKTLAARNKWLETFSRKARSPLIRNSSSSPSFLAAAAAASQHDVRRLGALGERHAGVPAMLNTDAGGRQRLPGGHAGLWDASSRFSVVRDLYDGYAADPVGEVERGKTSGDVSPSKRLLKQYVERQARIESLLEQRMRTGRVDLHGHRHAPAPMPRVSIVDVESFVMPPPADVNVEQPAGEVEVAPSTILEPPLEVVSMTPNAILDDRVLSNEEWSAGALFMPPSTRSFRLTIRPEESTEMKPVFIGIAPADANLSIVNFFDMSESVFLCMGGVASEALISALGAPGGPSFHAFGKRSVARLPVPPVGSTLSVQYDHRANDGNGEVIFFVGDEQGEGHFFAKPPLSRPLGRRGHWRPCVLLCMPGTRAVVEELV
mmetsp:Transcript_108215/g.304934  ORF Transcript_108215/g.304934 Transcript_108215/m.304934 type:complete len:634 (-) Transcript_108215:125-2026(-)